MRRLIVCSLALLPWLGGLADAAEIAPLKTQLPQASGKEVVLTIVSGDMRIKLTLAEIEKLPMQETRLNTPWGMNGVYDGVLLRDLLAVYKLNVESQLVINALDNYVSRISAQEINGGNAFLATRFNGKPIPLATKGPLILVWPEQEEAVLKRGVAPHSWVWSISQFTLQ